jgi:predicted DNA-binding WGR domain protein
MRDAQLAAEWRTPPPGFRAVRFDRTDRSANARRFYQVSWEPTLLDAGAVVRMYGRKGRWKRVAVTPFPSLAAAWPSIRAVVRTRLRHKYMIVAIEQQLPA